MESFEPKKLALIRIMQIFQTYSDYNHPLKQEDIARHLDDSINTDQRIIEIETGDEFFYPRLSAWISVG